MRRLRSDRALTAIAFAAAPLLDYADITGRVGRRSFWSAVLLAAGLLAIGYAMDWFVFGSARSTPPDFFAYVVGTVLVLPMLTLGVRRLRDVDRSGWLMLLLCVPVAGWLLLMRWWCAPSSRPAAPRQIGPLPPMTRGGRTRLIVEGPTLSSIAVARR